jgi:hypothetical protein
MSNPSGPGHETKESHPPTSAFASRSLARVDVPSTFQDPASFRQFSLYQLIYSLGGLVLGFACIIGGIVLFLHGVTGATSWTAKILGAQSTVSDAAPGVVLFIVGLFFVVVTRFNVRVKK